MSKTECKHSFTSVWEETTGNLTPENIWNAKISMDRFSFHPHVQRVCVESGATVVNNDRVLLRLDGWKVNSCGDIGNELYRKLISLQFLLHDTRCQGTGEWILREAVRPGRKIKKSNQKEVNKYSKHNFCFVWIFSCFRPYYSKKSVAECSIVNVLFPKFVFLEVIAEDYSWKPLIVGVHTVFSIQHLHRYETDYCCKSSKTYNVSLDTFPSTPGSFPSIKEVNHEKKTIKKSNSV